MPRPMAIQVCPMPAANTDAGSPMSTQALISDAPADSADTHAPIWRPPKK